MEFYFLLRNMPAIIHLIPPPPTFSMVSTLQMTTSATASISCLCAGSRLDHPLHEI